MKLSRTKFLAAVLAFASLTGFGFAQSEPSAPPEHKAYMRHHGMGEGPMLPFFAKELGLTDAQQAQIKEIFHNAKPAMKPLMQQEHQSHQAMIQLITSGNFDQAKAQAIVNQETQVHAQLTLQHVQLASRAYQVLTADQKTKLNELIAEHEQRMEQRMKEHAAPEEAPNQ